MKKSIISLILAAAKLLLLSLLCNLIYDWNDLAKVFGPTVSYAQWVGIVAISNLIFVDNTIKPKEKNDEQGS